MAEHQSTLGEILTKDLDKNPYLQEIYSRLLQAYAEHLFCTAPCSIPEPEKDIPIADALAFSNLLSKSRDPEKAEQHQLLGQEIIILIHRLFPKDRRLPIYSNVVLSQLGNYKALAFLGYQSIKKNILDEFLDQVLCDRLEIPGAKGKKFFPPQRAIYDQLSQEKLSYSGPTSMGKTFIMRMYMKNSILAGEQLNFAFVVPTKALINELTITIINDLKENLSKYDYRVINSGNSPFLTENHHFICVLTPERLLYLLISHPDFPIHMLFVDEAQNISSKSPRSTFYYKDIELLSHRKCPPQFIFASPNIPNPEIYLELTASDCHSPEEKFCSCYSPVSQFFFLWNQHEKQVRIYNPLQKELQSGTITHTYNDIEQYIQAHPNQQHILYCTSRDKAFSRAERLAASIPKLNNEKLDRLAQDIRELIHPEYQLADFIEKGIAFHVGYLPASIRTRIEELFRQRIINVVCCTSTLIEGINLPADNLFILSPKNGKSNFTPIIFKNLAGRVGRIEFNLCGNIFLIEDAPEDTEKYEALLKRPSKPVKLSVDTFLTASQKEEIVAELRAGSTSFKRRENMTNAQYSFARKAGMLLLKDLVNGQNSCITKAFDKQLKPEDRIKIKENFISTDPRFYDDINTTLDQDTAIEKAVRNSHLRYPSEIEYSTILEFLKMLSPIFSWPKYEAEVFPNEGILSKYASLLNYWMKEKSLREIIESTLAYKIKNNAPVYRYPRDDAHYLSEVGRSTYQNLVIAETLQILDNVILFTISNYFLRFSTAYRTNHPEEAEHFQDWYEYIEYGTKYPLCIFLQKIGFSRDSAIYIKRKQKEYVFTSKGMNSAPRYRLMPALLECRNHNVQLEARQIYYNHPNLYIQK